MANIRLSAIPALSKALSEHPDPYQHLLPLLAQTNDPDGPIPLLTPGLFSYLSTLTKSSDGGLQDIAVLEYSALLRGKTSRELFWAQRKETVGPLVDILRSAAGVSNGDSASTLWSGGASVRSTEGVIGGGVGLQLLYHVLLVLWQLSFEGVTVGEGLEE
jgi:V-type H+-transporting ATPase subunit H